ncbi:MAG: D-alanyl-D-alanine carboxypeptidase [Clostridia bacterium]|nr:D-alanyl-D-alanine carboxypeptidase [Clostridia bacterium]
MKKLLPVFLSVILIFSANTFVFAEDVNMELSAKSAVLIEPTTGKILFEKASHDRLPPASVTKVMTMLLVMEALDNGQCKLEDMVRTSSLAASMGGSQVFLEENEEMIVHDMLKAVAVASGNDAAVALAEFIGGSHENFVAKMNERAKQLGMNDTTFINCNGLDDPNHLTSAHDIALMSSELIKHPKIFDYTTIWMDSLRGSEFGLVNTNKLIRFYTGATGLKTGSTSVAGFCISASAKRDNMNLIAVVMGSPSSKERFADATKLLDYGFANYAISNSLVKDEELPDIKVQKGTENSVKIGLSDDFNMLLEKSKINSIEKNITLPEHINAPIKENDKIGEVEFFIDGNSIGKADIVTKNSIKGLGPLGMFLKLTRSLVF